MPCAKYLHALFDREAGTCRARFWLIRCLKPGFGWQPAERTLGGLEGKLLHPALVGALREPQKKGLSEDYSFPARRRPYRHQLDAWRALIEDHPPRSVLVSSGTGSGKTECFLIPILNDLAAELERRQNAPLIGVRALFLYPLNALDQEPERSAGRLVGTLQWRHPLLPLQRRHARSGSKAMAL
jgi:DEAD/DEAH box helicase domain-containing protein